MAVRCVLDETNSEDWGLGDDIRCPLVGPLFVLSWLDSEALEVF